MARLDPVPLPQCTMERIILHWTAGTHKASTLDREHYHVLIEGDGTVVAGTHQIDRNAKPVREPRASHTRNLNTASIGVSLCCMKDAREKPFLAGPFPMTRRQWEVAAEVVAELCQAYGIRVTPKTVLAHGEVEAVLKVPQLQKWDPLVLPFSPTTPRTQVMEQFRTLVSQHLASLLAATPPPATPPPATPQTPGPSGGPAQPPAGSQPTDADARERHIDLDD